MRFLPSLLLIALLGACGSTPESKKAEPPAEVPAISKIGVVGHVQIQQERAIDHTNWKTAILGVIINTSKNDQDATVVRTIYEVTVFYDAGQHEILKLDYDPQLKPGQRVRVTGKKIEVLPR